MLLSEPQESDPDHAGGGMVLLTSFARVIPLPETTMRCRYSVVAACLFPSFAATAEQKSMLPYSGARSAPQITNKFHLSVYTLGTFQ